MVIDIFILRRIRKYLVRKRGSGKMVKLKGLDMEKYIFEDAPVSEAIARLAFPAVMGQIILVIYNMADTFYVGLTGSDAMLAAVTVCMPAFMFLSAIANLFGVGGASVISRAMGGQNTGRARHASAFAFWGCLLVTVIFSLLTWSMMDPFINLLGGTHLDVHYHARAYMTVTVVLGGAVTSMNMLLAHLIRSEGRSMQASFGVLIGGLLNIALDPLFMFVILEPGNEALGAAIATTLSNLIGTLYLASFISKTRYMSVLSFRLGREMLEEQTWRDVVISGFPAFLMTLLENVSYAVLDKLMSLSGMETQAGIGVAKKVNMLAHCIVRGMAQGVLPLIGYNYASGNHRRMRDTVVTSTVISTSMALLCTAASLFYSRQLIGVFIQGSSDSLNFGAKFLQILSIGAPFSAVAYQFISFFQATGHGSTSLILAILRKGVLDIPLIFLLNRLIPIFGIVWATPIADIACCATAVAAFALFIKQHTNLFTDENAAVPNMAKKPITAE